MSYRDYLPLPLTCQDCGYENKVTEPETLPHQPYRDTYALLLYEGCEKCGGHNLVMIIPPKVWQDLIVPDKEVSHSAL